MIIFCLLFIPKILDFSDRDECTDGSNTCDGGTCIDTVGSYRCECHEGQELMDDRRTCIGMKSFLIFLLVLAVSQNDIETNLHRWYYMAYFFINSFIPRPMRNRKRI